MRNYLNNARESMLPTANESPIILGNISGFFLWVNNDVDYLQMIHLILLHPLPLPKVFIIYIVYQLINTLLNITYFSGQMSRPSEYLRARCPLCFGGQNWSKPDEVSVLL